MMARSVTSKLRHEAQPAKGSRFIATVAPVANEAQARDLLEEVANERPGASHHCWAWRLASPAIDRAGDDGEPSGSAGRPILAQLSGRNLVDTAVVVTRYFGGTKLGVGGLVRAYGGAAGEALDRVATAPWSAQVAAVVVHDHPDTDAVIRVLQAQAVTEIDVVYAARVTRFIEVDEPRLGRVRVDLANATSGRATLT